MPYFFYPDNLTGNDTYTKILLHMDGANSGTSFPDTNFGGTAKTWTAHSAITDTSTFEFGLSSENCGSTGYIDCPTNADFNLGTGDWTIDHWFNINTAGNGTARNAFGLDDGATNQAYLGFMTAANVFSCFASIGGSSFSITGTVAITTAGWHHMAFVRTGTSLMMFIDGTQQGTTPTVSGTVLNPATTFSVGRSGARAASNWNGFIDEFRLSVGIARWTSNFTPPTQPYGPN